MPFSYNGDGVRTSKTVAGDTTEYVLDLAAGLPLVISDTEAVYLFGLDDVGNRLQVVETLLPPGEGGGGFAESGPVHYAQKGKGVRTSPLSPRGTG